MAALTCGEARRYAVIRELHTRNPWLTWAGGAHLVLFAVLLGLMAFDDRTIMAENVWLKPSKFALSIGVYLLTMAWLTGELKRPRWLVGLAGLTILASMSMEQVLITMQAFRGTTSHYNIATTFDSDVYKLMGDVVIANTAAVLLLLLVTFFHRIPGREAYMWGVRLGLAIFLAGSLEAIEMIRRGAHSVGMADGGPGLWILNWNTHAGDLRIAHFLGIHAIQILPIAGIAVDRLLHRAMYRRAAALLAAILYGLLCWSAYLTAMTGRPGVV